jgi:hypothetical protein
LLLEKQLWNGPFHFFQILHAFVNRFSISAPAQTDAKNERAGKRVDTISAFLSLETENENSEQRRSQLVFSVTKGARPCKTSNERGSFLKNA